MSKLIRARFQLKTNMCPYVLYGYSSGKKYSYNMNKQEQECCLGTENYKPARPRPQQNKMFALRTKLFPHTE